jgi:hypothetical protein
MAHYQSRKHSHKQRTLGCYHHISTSSSCKTDRRCSRIFFWPSYLRTGLAAACLLRDRSQIEAKATCRERCLVYLTRLTVVRGSFRRGIDAPRVITSKLTSLNPNTIELPACYGLEDGRADHSYISSKA